MLIKILTMLGVTSIFAVGAGDAQFTPRYTVTELDSLGGHPRLQTLNP